VIFPFSYNTGYDRQTDGHVAVVNTRSKHSVAGVKIMKILEKKLLVILITDNLPNEQTKEKKHDWQR